MTASSRVSVRPGPIRRPARRADLAVSPSSPPGHGTTRGCGPNFSDTKPPVDEQVCETAPGDRMSTTPGDSSLGEKAITGPAGWPPATDQCCARRPRRTISERKRSNTPTSSSWLDVNSPPWTPTSVTRGSSSAGSTATSSQALGCAALSEPRRPPGVTQSRRRWSTIAVHSRLIAGVVRPGEGST
jgi:hypothetical protein